MNYDVSVIRIIVYSLAVAFCITKMLIPFLKESYIKFIHWQYKAIGKPYAQWFAEFNRRAVRVRELRLKPLDCTKCLTFWCSLILAIACGLQLEAAFVGVVGLFAGALLEGILMRYF
jgi:hypothetical protein